MMQPHRNDVVITGLPRSGTTLTCELLNDAPDTVALDEPIDRSPWSGGRTDRRRRTGRRPRRLMPRRWQRDRTKPLDPDHFVGQIQDFFASTRRSLHEGKGAVSKNVGGKVTGRKFLDERSDSGLRDQITRFDVITIDKQLSDDFVLAVKHNAGFTVTLEHLAPHFRTFAIVRNPLAMLASWQTVPIPINRGRVLRAELVDRELRLLLDSTESVLDRQFILLDWFFGKYKAHLLADAVIKYEDVVATGGRALAPISPGASELDAPLESRNRTKVYDEDSVLRIGKRLLATDGPWWDYYSPDAVRELIEA